MPEQNAVTLYKLSQETPDPGELKRKYLEITLFEAFPP